MLLLLPDMCHNTSFYFFLFNVRKQRNLHNLSEGKKKINGDDRAKNEKITEMTYAINENFNVYRRFVLTIVLKIVDREKNVNNVTVGNEATNENFDIIIVNNETISEKKFVITFDVVNEKKESILLVSLL